MKDEEVKEEPRNKKDEKSSDGTMSITSFYGKSVEDSGDDSGGNNWGSIVKRRRVLAAQAAAEKEKKDRERMLQKEKEYQV